MTWTAATRGGHVRLGEMYASDVTDREWALIAPHLPAARPGGRPRSACLRRVVNAEFCQLQAGCQSLPSRAFGKCPRGAHARGTSRRAARSTAVSEAGPHRECRRISMTFSIATPAVFRSSRGPSPTQAARIHASPTPHRARSRSIKCTDPGFIVQPKSRVIERTVAWACVNRRLGKDFERFSATAQAMFQIAMIKLMTRRHPRQALSSQALGVLPEARDGDGHA